MMDIIEKENVIERKSWFPSGDVLGSVAGRIFVRGTAGIDLQDYVDSVVEAFTIDGVFISVPPEYQLHIPLCQLRTVRREHGNS